MRTFWINRLARTWPMKLKLDLTKVSEAGITAITGVLLAGCGTPPPPDQTGQLSLNWPNQWQAEAAAASTNFSAGWLEDFQDPRLKELVQEAIDHNRDLQAAAARVESFRANSVIAGADRLPQMTGGASASRSERSIEQGDGFVDVRSDTFGLNLDLSWEVDVWGRLRDQASAAVADYQASQADYRAARLSIAAQTAQAWFNVLEAYQQVQLAQDTVTSFEDNLEVVMDRYRNGLSGALDVHLIRANVGNARSSLQFRRQQLDGAARILEVLLGRYPARQVEVAGRLPQITAPVPAGLPAQLLDRRPDLRAAERRLAAADRRVREAKKSLLPQIQLTASGGTSAPELAEIADPDFGLWTLAANLAQPIFQGRRLVAGIDRSEADRDEALAGYAQTALQAFREVETSLAAEEYLAAEETALRQTVESSVAAEDLAWEQYERGVIDDIITVLESQRRSFDSQRQLLQVSNERLQNRIDLYLALGGDFHVPEAPSANEQPKKGAPAPDGV